MIVKSFFQNDTESALISQVQWLQNEVGLSDQFFSHLLNVEEDAFCTWRAGKGVLSEEQQHTLKEFWQTMLHLLSFLNFDLNRLSVMLEHVDDTKTYAIKLPFAQPWIGTSLKAYLELQGTAGIRKVNQWVQSLRFGDL